MLLDGDFMARKDKNIVDEVVEAATSEVQLEEIDSLPEPITAEVGEFMPVDSTDHAGVGGSFIDLGCGRRVRVT
jgi:hypothetical protein